MKNFISKSNPKNPKSFSVFLCLLALAATLLVTSCNNFMNAKEVKSEIEDAIAASKQQLQQKDDSIKLLQELNRKLAEEVRSLREQLQQYQSKQQSQSESSPQSSSSS